MTAAAPAATAPPPEWGVTLTCRRRVVTRAALSKSRTLFGAVAVVLAIALGALGTVTASTAPARADIFGISDAVQDWLCGISRPTEPWEAVGDGPESWMANKNLTGAVPPAQLIAAADGVSTAAVAGSATTTAPATMDQVRALPAGNYTLYEVAGLRGLSWWTIPANPDGSKNCDLWAYIWTQAANLVFSANKTLLQVIIAVHESAETSDPLAFLYDASGGILADVFTLFFMPVALIMLIFTGMWLGIQGARGRGTPRQALGAVGAAMAITALGAFAYLINTDGQDGFRGAAKTVDTMISQANAVGTNAIFDHLTDPGQACALPKDAVNIQRGIRATSCVLADALAYRPWEIGQFGGAGANPIPIPANVSILMPAHGVITFDRIQAAMKSSHAVALPCYVNFNGCKDLRTYLIAQHGGVQIAEAPNGHTGYLMCANSAAAGKDSDFAGFMKLVGSEMCSPMDMAWQVLAVADQATARAYAGDVGIARVSQAFSALMGTAVIGASVIILSLIALSWAAMTFVLYCIGPFKLAFATYAGKVKIAREWLVDLVYAWLARLVYGFVLALVVMIIMWLMAADLSFGMRMVWLAVILFMFWKMLQKIQKLIRPGAASMDPDVVGGVRKGIGQVSKHSRRSAVGGFDGVRDSVSRARDRMTDPTRGRIRRTISTVASPLAVLGGGLRGAATGRTGPERRMEKALAGARRRPTTSTNPGRSTSEGKDTSKSRSRSGSTGGSTRPGGGRGDDTARSTRKAGTRNPNSVKAKDAPSRVYLNPRPNEPRSPGRAARFVDSATGTPPVGQKPGRSEKKTQERRLVSPVSRPTPPKNPAPAPPRAAAAVIDAPRPRPTGRPPVVEGAPRRPRNRARSTDQPAPVRPPLPPSTPPAVRRELPRAAVRPARVKELEPARPPTASKQPTPPPVPAARRKVDQ